MQCYIQNDVIIDIKNAKYLGTIIDHHIIINNYYGMSISTASLARLITLNVFFSGTSLKTPVISKAFVIRAWYVLSWNMLTLCWLLIHKRIYQQLRQCRCTARHVTYNYSNYVSVSDTLIHLQRESLKITML